MTLFSDDFGRADANNVGGNYEYQSGSTSTTKVTVTSGRARAGVTSFVLVRLLAGNGPTTGDQFSSIALTSGDGNAQEVAVRSSGTQAGANLTNYCVDHTATTVELRRNDVGSAVVLGSLTRTRAAGDRIAIVAQGSTIVGFVNGVEFARATDSTYTTGRPGFVTFGTVGVLLDDYAAGDYPTDAAGRSDMPASLSGGGGGATKTPNPATALTAGTATTSTQPLSWTPAVVDGTHDAATSYLVEYQVSGASAWTAGPATSASSTTVSGLSPGTAYVYRVTASNAAGSAAPSSTLAASTPAGVVVSTNLVNISGLPPWRGLIHNPAGERILAGEMLHRVSADFGFDATLPSWLTCPEGTTGFTTDAGGALTLATAATVGSRATLRLARVLPSAGIAAVHLELRGHRFTAASPVVDWRLFATNAVGGAAGASALCLSSEAAVTLASGGESSRTSTPQTVISADAARRRPTGLLVSTATKEVWLMEGDSIVGYRDCTSTWTDGDLYVGVSITAQAAVAAELRLSSVVCSVYV